MQCKQCANLLKRRWLPCLKMAYNLFGCSKSLWCYNFILNAYEHYNSRVQTGVINRHTYQALSSEHDSLQAKGSRLFGDAKSDKICHQNVLNYIKSNRKVYRTQTFGAFGSLSFFPRFWTPPEDFVAPRAILFFVDFFVVCWELIWNQQLFRFYS